MAIWTETCHSWTNCSSKCLGGPFVINKNALLIINRFWCMHMPSYSQLTKLLYQVTSKKESFWEGRETIFWPGQAGGSPNSDISTDQEREQRKDFVIYQCRKEQQFVATRAGVCGHEHLRRWDASCWDSEAGATKEPKINTFLWSKRFKLQMRTFCTPLKCWAQSSHCGYTLDYMSWVFFLFKDSKPTGGRTTSARWQKCVLAVTH